MNSSKSDRKSVDSILQGFIKKIFGEDVSSRIEIVSGGSYVEVVCENKQFNLDGAREQFFDELTKFNQEHGFSERIALQRLFLYLSEDEKYCVNSLLHTKEAEFNDYGTFTVYLSAGDARGWICEFDAEVLTAGCKTPRKIFFKSVDKTDKLFQVNLKAEYKQLAFEGELLSVVEPIAKRGELYQLAVGY